MYWLKFIWSFVTPPTPDWNISSMNFFISSWSLILSLKLTFLPSLSCSIPSTLFSDLILDGDALLPRVYWSFSSTSFPFRLKGKYDIIILISSGVIIPSLSKSYILNVNLILSSSDPMNISVMLSMNLLFFTLSYRLKCTVWYFLFACSENKMWNRSLIIPGSDVYSTKDTLSR